MKKLTVFLTVIAVLLAAAGFNVKGADAYEYAANTQKHESNLGLSPSVITELKDSSILEQIGGSSLKPSNLIVHIDGQANVVDVKGTIIDSFHNLFTGFFKVNKIIPVIFLEEEEAADALISYLFENRIVDLAVMSRDSDLVKSVRSTLTDIRGIVDFSKRNFTKGDLADMLSECNMAMSNVAVFEQGQIDAEIVNYFQFRLKAVWVYGGDAEFDVYRNVSKGVYGIITDNYEGTYGCYQNYDELSLARPFLNIAHRGLPISYPENSLDGAIEAYNKGATHIEIDVKLSKDKQLIVMHDDTLDRTTDGKGSVYNMTLEEIRQYKIIKNINGLTLKESAEIPTLDDFFSYFKGKDCILVVEIKTEQTDFCEYFKKKMDQYDMYGQVIVISFSNNQLKAMKEQLPEVPTATLNSVYQNTFGDDLALLSKLNTVVNGGYPLDYGYFQNRNLKNRGHMSLQWTYNDTGTALKDIVKGVMGITNNVADSFSSFSKSILPLGGYSIEENEQLAQKSFAAKIVRYNGEETDAEVSVFKYLTHGDYAEVIFKYHDNMGYAIYSEPVRVEIVKNDIPEDTPAPSKEPSQSKKGCFSTFDITFLTALTLVCFGLAVIRTKKIKGDISCTLE